MEVFCVAGMCPYHNCPCYNFDLYCMLLLWGVCKCVCLCLSFRNARRSIKLDRKVEDKGSRRSKQQSLKYTAAKLHEKGVILEIEGLQTNQ